MGCSCGLWTSWPLLARIHVDADTVTWASFRQSNRPQWGRLPMGQFTFAAGAYVGPAGLAHGPDGRPTQQ